MYSQASMASAADCPSVVKGHDVRCALILRSSTQFSQKYQKIEAIPMWMEICGPIFIKYLIALRFVTKSTGNLGAYVIRLPPHALCAQGRDGCILRFLMLFNHGERKSFPTIKKSCAHKVICNSERRTLEYFIRC